MPVDEFGGGLDCRKTGAFVRQVFGSLLRSFLRATQWAQKLTFNVYVDAFAGTGLIEKQKPPRLDAQTSIVRRIGRA